MNTLRARVLSTESVEKLSVSHFVCVDTELSMISLELPERFMLHREVTLGFNAMAVGVAKSFEGELSYSNQLKCTLQSITKGKLLCELLLSFGSQQLRSIITTQRAEAMGLVKGDTLIALIKANELFVVEVH